MIIEHPSPALALNEKDSRAIRFYKMRRIESLLFKADVVISANWRPKDLHYYIAMKEKDIVYKDMKNQSRIFYRIFLGYQKYKKNPYEWMKAIYGTAYPGMLPVRLIVTVFDPLILAGKQMKYHTSQIAFLLSNLKLP